MRRIVKRQRISRIEMREARGCPRHDDLHSNAEPDLEQQSRSWIDLSLHYVIENKSTGRESHRSQKNNLT